MAVRVEERPVAAHMDLWRRLLSQTRDTPVDARVLAWRYLENPAGPARAWVLVDDATGDVGGFTVVMPRRMQLQGRPLQAWIGADFSILPRYRALGPALQLRRAARDAIDRGEADLLYAFPNQRMMLIHERAGHRKLGMLQRLALPAALRRHLARVLRSDAAAALVAPLADIAWRAAQRARRMTGRHRVELLDSGAANGDLAVPGTTAVMDRVAGVRDAEYLRWRYFRQPEWRGGVLLARRAARPTGYLAFTQESGLLQISDLMATDAGAAVALLARSVELASARGLASVSYVALERGIWDTTLTSFGFRPREEQYAVYAYVPERHAALVSATDPQQWHLTVGDRDI